MLEPRKKKKKSWNKWAAIFPIILVLISSVLVFNGKVWSNEAGIQRNIIFNNQAWDMLSGSFKENWKTNSETVGFTVDLSDDYENAQIQGEVVQPIDVIVEHNGKTLETTINQVNEETGFTGKYKVVIPFTVDGQLDITIKIITNETWGLVEADHKFNIVRDATAPQVTLSGPTDNLLTDKIVTVDVEVIEEHFSTNSVEVNVIRNDKEYEVPVWENTGKNTIKSYDFIEEGEYTFTVKAADETGNANLQKQLNFSIRKNAPVLTVFAGDKQLDQNEISNTQKLTLKVTSKISLDAAKATIDREGAVGSETIDLVVNGREANLDYPIKSDGKYNLTVWVKEKHNSGKSYTLAPFTFITDQTPPKLSILDIDNGEIYETDKKVNITVEDAHFGTADFIVTKTDINGKKTTVTIPIKDGEGNYDAIGEGEYKVTLNAVDQLGNKAETQTKTFKIDKEKPRFTFSEDVDGKYFNTDKALTIAVEDITLNLEQTVINVKKGNEPYSIGTLFQNLFKAEVTHKFTNEGTYEVNLESQDEKHPLLANEHVTFTIDKTPPLIESQVVEKEVKVDGELKKVKDVIVTVTDEHMDWMNTSMEVFKNDEKLSTITGKSVSDTHLFKDDGIYEIKIKAADKTGTNIEHPPITFTIDNTKPKLNINGVIDGEHYQKLENLELSIEDLTFLLDKVELKILKDGAPYEADGAWEETRSKGKLDRAIRKLTFDQDGDYEISLITEDFFENKNELRPIKFTIDNTDPVIDLSGIKDGDFVQKGKTVNVSVKEHNFEHNMVTITAEKDGAKYNFGDWKNNGETSELSHIFKEDGDYKIMVEAIDRAKNEAVVKTLRFTVDNIKPGIDILGPKQNSYHNNDKNVKITVEEHNFANNKVDIKVTRKVEVDGKPVDYPIGEWKNVKEVSDLSYLFDRDGEYEITVEGTDAAGNKGDTEKLLFTIDKTDPTVNLETDIENSQNYRTNMLVKMRAEDRNIDLSNTNLEVKKNGKTFDVGKLKLLGDSKTVAYNSYTFFEEGSYVINLKTKDKAGNTKKHDQLAFIIDKTNPVVKIDGVKNNSFNPENKNVTISIDEWNYKTNNVSITATKDGAPFNIGNWGNTGKLSKLGYNFTRDGLYTILATAEDKAGNGPIAEKMTFTIDKTNPEIEITGVENNAYYNVDKPVNVSIKDVNLDINKITVTRNGARYNAGGFSVNGDLASLRHNFSGEGEYNILVEATDKAGNSFGKTMNFTIDKTKPVITPKFKGQNRVIKDGEYINEVFTPEFALDEAEDMIVSATLNNGANLGKNIPVAAREMKYIYKVLARDKAGNESTLEISFTLDTTKPALNISGVLDGFFNKDITPKVTYSDIHLDSSKTSVTLNGKPFENDTKLKYEQDYILKAVVTDLANNVSSRTIVFTIDKTKPVIKFKETISNNYFNTDLLPQLLIEDMSSYDIITMMLDGKPYEAGDPIKEEGKHVMFFEVKDKAGNIQQLSVEFIIDKTAPKVVYEGVKNKGKYYDPVDISIRLDNPNDKIKSIMINGELFDGQVVEENGYQVIKTKLGEIKPYEIKVTASDEAGNEKTTVISFEIVEKGALVKFYENKPLLGGTVAGLVGLLGAAATLLVRRRKLKVEEE